MAAVWLVTPRRANRDCAYVHRRAAWAIQTGFGAVTGWFLFTAAAAAVDGSRGSLRAPGWWSWLVLTAPLGAYLINGLGPYVGFKSEFSMAMFSNLRSTDWNHLVFRDRWRLRDGADCIVVSEISGLPTASEVRGDPAAELARAALARPETFKYRPYFFFEALARLAAVGARPPRISGRVQFRNRDYALPAGRPPSLPPAGFPPWRRINAFPFLMPLDPEAPASEQGSVLSDDRNRQLF